MTKCKRTASLRSVKLSLFGFKEVPMYSGSEKASFPDMQEVVSTLREKVRNVQVYLSFDTDTMQKLY